MARPKKQTVDYFPHYVAGGKTLFILENTYGNDGYAFWFKLLEILGSTEGHIYDCNNSFAWKFLIAKTRASENVANEMLDTLAELEAIDRELWQERTIWVQNFINNIADAYKKRNVSLPSKPSFRNRKQDLNGVSVTENSPNEDVSRVSVTENPQMKVEESKVNEIKGEESSNHLPILLTNDEAEFLEILKSVKDYPLDRQKDIDFYDKLTNEFPGLDVVKSVKQWSIYKLDKPLKKNSNPRSQINNWCQKDVEFKKNLKEEPDEINRGNDEGTYDDWETFYKRD